MWSLWPWWPGAHNISESSNVIQYYCCKSELGAAVHTGPVILPLMLTLHPSELSHLTPISLQPNHNDLNPDNWINYGIYRNITHCSADKRCTHSRPGSGCHCVSARKYSQMTFTLGSIINRMPGSGHNWLMGGIKIHFLFRPCAEFHNNDRFSFGGVRYRDKEINKYSLNIHDSPF